MANARLWETHEEDVDEEVHVAASLEEDTDWRNEDGEAGATTSESDHTAVSRMGYIQDLQGTVSTTDTRTWDGHAPCRCQKQ